MQVLSPQVEPLAGESLSPNGLWEVQLVGVNEGITASGLYAPEYVKVVNTQTGAVCWEDQGYYEQEALWSPEGGYLALSRASRTHAEVTIIHPDSGSAWEFTLPDGRPIPEYTFLPEDWGAWEDEHTLRLIVGRGGDGGEQHSYRCVLEIQNGGIVSSVLDVDKEPSYDFDHDGTVETVCLTKRVQDAASGAVIWKLDVMEEGVSLWSDTAHPIHAGWNSVFACKLDGRDYLLRYYPTMYQGWCTYNYQVFSLDETGGEILLQERAVEFDLNWNRPDHKFDAETVLAFVEELNGVLETGTLLMSSDDAVEGWDPQRPQESLWWLQEDSICPDYTYDETASLGENLHTLEAAMEMAHALAKPAEPG